MRKWRLPLTYKPKVEPVLLGTCRQTIRKGWKKQKGDLIRFFVWSGKPYRSKQIGLTEYEPLKEVINCKIGPDGCIIGSFVLQMTETMDSLAVKDGIVPPTGKELGRILTQFNKIPAEGLELQIIRW